MLAALLLILVIVTAYLVNNIQRVREQSSAALSAAEALRATQAAEFLATVSAASYGSLSSAPLKLQNEIEEIENTIAKLQQKLNVLEQE